MAEPLAVDPTRLIAAGAKLAELVFPTAPPPMTVAGSDPVSTAINATMPGIEALVSDGLPGVSAALKLTASNMATAGDIYTKADQSLGEALRQYSFDANGQGLGITGASAAAAAASPMMGASGVASMLAGAGVAGAPAGAAAQVRQLVGAQVSELSPRVAATIPQVVQLAPQATQMGQQMSPIVQTITQSAQQGASSGSQGGGAAPAQLASDTKPADEDTEDADASDATDAAGADGAEGAEGAAAGVRTVGSVPTGAGVGASGTPVGTTV